MKKFKHLVVGALCSMFLVFFVSCVKNEIKMTVMTEDHFTGDWLSGEWIMTGESNNQKETITVRITGYSDDSIVKVFYKDRSEDISFSEFKKDFFENILQQFPEEELLEQWKDAGIFYDYDGNLYINEEKTFLQKKAVFRFGEEEHITSVTLEKKIAEPVPETQAAE